MSSIASIHLIFDGLPTRSSNNPLSGCWGAIINIHLTPRNILSQQHSGPLGFVSATVAKYLALIRGLNTVLSYIEHRLAHNPKHYSIHLYNNSQVCLNQLLGNYKVQAPNVKPLHMVAVGLLKRFHSFTVKVVIKSYPPFKQATTLANAAASSSAKLTANARPIYRPSLLSLVPITVAGGKTIASHDIGSITDTVYLIDASFLHSLPKGEVYLQLLRDCAPVQIIPSGFDLTALGKISLPSQVFWTEKCTEKVAKLPFIVVDSLPVPVHISVRKDGYFRGYNIDLFAPLPRDVLSFDVTNVPVQYRNHPYWKPDRPLVVPDNYDNEDSEFKGIIVNKNTIADIVASALRQDSALSDSDNELLQQVKGVLLKQPKEKVVQASSSKRNASGECSLEQDSSSCQQTSQKSTTNLQNSSKECVQQVPTTNEDDEIAKTDDKSSVTEH